MKKTLLTLGSIASLATPIIAVVSCGSSENTATNTAPIYSQYNMKSIYDMKTADKTALNELIVDANKGKTFDEFKALVHAKNMDALNEKMINDIMEHYKDTAGKITVGWHVLHFALATTDNTQLMLAYLGWHDISDATLAQNQVKAYILEGTIDTRAMAKSIIDKFAGRDGEHFNNSVVQGALALNESAHKFTVNGVMGETALRAMGGKETLKVILDHGTGHTWTIEDAPAANPSA